MEVSELCAAKKVVGTKETLRMIEKHLCKTVFIANDASEKVLAPLLKSCAENGVEIIRVDNMKYLGECCGIKVAAASVGIL